MVDPIHTWLRPVIGPVALTTVIVVDAPVTVGPVVHAAGAGEDEEVNTTSRPETPEYVPAGVIAKVPAGKLSVNDAVLAGVYSVGSEYTSVPFQYQLAVTLFVPAVVEVHIVTVAV